MKALNYCAEAIQCFSKQSWPFWPESEKARIWLLQILKKAEVFQLPDEGVLLDRTKLVPEVPQIVWKPPFPVTALEFYMPKTPVILKMDFADSADENYSPKRISLVVDSDHISCELDFLKHFFKESGVLQITLYEIEGRWTVHPFVSFMKYNDSFMPISDYSDSIRIDMAPLAKDQDTFPTVYFGFLLPEGAEQMLKEAGGDLSKAATRAAVETNDERSAYHDMVFTLHCKNVSYEKVKPSKLRQSLKKGKTPLKDYHVLKIPIADSGRAGYSSSGGGLKRAHLRRGHIRRLSDDRRIWVNATFVRGHGGFVDKSYKVGG